MKKLVNIYIILLILLIILIMVLGILRLKSINPESIDISPEFLHKIIPPGTYKGTSIITPSETYKNGIKAIHRVVIKKDNNNGIEFQQKIIGYDLITNKFKFEGKRIGRFYYKSNHGKHLFKEVDGYINGNIVSTLEGYAINKTPNSISFSLSGARSYTSTKYKDVISVINRPQANEIVQEVKHKNIYGINEFYIKEEYTRI